jgi:MOSC domain-containing protein YiiM
MTVRDSRLRIAGHVEAVCASATHGFAKETHDQIVLLQGHGVAADAHAGMIVRHLYTARKHPGRPNRRQVHLIARRLYDRLLAEGFVLAYGSLGENIVTRGIDLAAMPEGAALVFSSGAILTLTELREPCVKIDRFHRGLRRAVSIAQGTKSAFADGVFAVVACGGDVRPGDRITVHLPRGSPSQLRLPA